MEKSFLKFVSSEDSFSIASNMSSSVGRIDFSHHLLGSYAELWTHVNIADSARALQGVKELHADLPCYLRKTQVNVMMALNIERILSGKSSDKTAAIEDIIVKGLVNLDTRKTMNHSHEDCNPSIHDERLSLQQFSNEHKFDSVIFAPGIAINPFFSIISASCDALRRHADGQWSLVEIKSFPDLHEAANTHNYGAFKRIMLRHCILDDAAACTNSCSCQCSATD